MRRFSILGISLSDLTAREGLKQTDKYLKSGALNTITYLTTQTLAQAAQDERVRKLVEATDLTLCVEPDILEAAGIANPGRIHEIEERVFLIEFLKRLARQQTAVYVLADTRQQALSFAGMLHGQQESLNIVESRGYEEFGCQQERLMNELNEAAPGVIFSRMAWPADLELMHAGRKFLNAEIWIALPEKKLPGRVKPTVIHQIKKKLFQKKVNEYNEERAAQ